jgi:hypothetical protein
VTTKVIVIALAFTVASGMLALADDASNLQAKNSANFHVMNLDRCPYYPSPVFCRSVSRAHEQNELGHNADGR